ncbi:hypothetical protein [Xylanimonas sp. McL0601]|uniref:hypothetical protein n=1 Tax=Xylanimonas sp. McL0601 TaxID=3414739 RepID=UPI003CF21A76
MWWIELRRSSLVWAIVPLAVGWVWLTFSRSQMWLGAWPAATANAAAPTGYAVIVLGALVAAEAARRRVNAPAAALRLSRHGMLAVAMQLSVGVVLSLIPMAVALAAVTIRNAGSAPPGHLWWSYVTFATVALVAALSAAHLIGSAGPSVPIAALAGAGAGYIVPAYADIPLNAPPNLGLSTTRLWVLVTIAVVALICAALVPSIATMASPGRTHTLGRTLAGACAVAGVVAVVFAPAAGPIQVARPVPEDPVCSTARPRVCVWPEHAAYLPLLTPVAARIAQAADGVLTVPDTFLEEGLSDNAYAPNTFSWMAPRDGVWSAAEGMGGDVLNTTSSANNCWPDNDADWNRLRALTSQLSYWLAARGYGANRPGTYHGQFQDAAGAIGALQLDEHQQAAWATDILKQSAQVPCVVDNADQ